MGRGCIVRDSKILTGTAAQGFSLFGDIFPPAAGSFGKQEEHFMLLVTPTEELARAFGDEPCIRILADAGYVEIDWSFFDMVTGMGPVCGDNWQ